MCLMFVIPIDGNANNNNKDDTTRNDQLFQVIYQLLQTNADDNYHDCSAR